MSSWQPPLFNEEAPQAYISPSVVTYAEDSRACGYCGEPFTYEPQHTCPDYLMDCYRPGNVYPIDSNQTALVLQQVDGRIVYLPIAPGQMRQMTVEEFNEEVRKSHVDPK